MQAVFAVAAIRADPDRHRHAVRELAREHCDAERQMGRMLEQAGLTARA